MMVSALEPAPVAGACTNCHYLFDNRIQATHSPEVSAEVDSAVVAVVDVCICIRVAASVGVAGSSRWGMCGGAASQDYELCKIKSSWITTHREPIEHKVVVACSESSESASVAGQTGWVGCQVAVGAAGIALSGTDSA